MSPPPWWVRLPETTGHQSKEHSTTELLGAPLQQQEARSTMANDEPVNETTSGRSDVQRPSLTLMSYKHKEVQAQNELRRDMSHWDRMI
jgi:hypothetical protein